MGVRRRPLKRLACKLLLAVAAAPPVIAGTWTAMLAHWGPPSAAEAGVLYSHATGLDSALSSEPNRNATIVDDAGRCCRCDEIAVVELRVATDGVNYIGHAFLHTPRRTVGFRTHEADISAFDFVNPFSPSLPGFVRDDATHEYDRVKVFRACPQTLAALESAIDENAGSPYQIGDWNGGRNCATWATHCLQTAGLTPPEGSFPNQLARHMRPVLASFDDSTTGGDCDK